jgi:hypothetical protein
MIYLACDDNKAMCNDYEYYINYVCDVYPSEQEIDYFIKLNNSIQYIGINKEKNETHKKMSIFVKIAHCCLFFAKTCNC